MSSEDGQGRTPRRTTRRTTATPVRAVSPPSRNARATSMAAQNTPATRRSARMTSRKSDQPRDVVNNNVLPEIQTRQSYAYGSSKTPLLPEQLHVRETLTMNQVADQMQSAINQAEQNLDTLAGDVVNTKDQAQTQTNNRRNAKRTSKEPSPPVSVTTELQKKQRTAAWADALENGQLEDIAEEEQTPVDSPETKRTEPSSFPSGIFDQSYQYERGLRPPRRPPGQRKDSFGTRLGSLLGSVFDRMLLSLHQFQQAMASAFKAMGSWLSRLFSSITTSIAELPDSQLFSILIKTFSMLVLTAILSYVFCFTYSRYLCNPAPTSRISQTLESWCGDCQTTRPYLNFTTTSAPDLRELNAALKRIDTQIRSIEVRLNSRLDSKVSALHTDINDLRKEQTDLIHQIEEVSRQSSQQVTTPSANSFTNRVNYFSPANGAIVNVPITSPTRQAPIALPLRLLTRMLGIQKYRAYNPVMALEPWHDVGDCWCAAATTPTQDSIRLGVGVKEYIYPTELVIEHPSMDTSLTPETAPRRVELWADFSHHHDTAQWNDLGLETMTNDLDGVAGPFGKKFAMVASVEYDLKKGGPHDNVQRFALDVNQYGDLKYSALDFAVRVRETWGAEYGCLYRVRLHGVPVEKRDVLASGV